MSVHSFVTALTEHILKMPGQSKFKTFLPKGLENLQRKKSWISNIIRLEQSFPMLQSMSRMTGMENVYNLSILNYPKLPFLGSGGGEGGSRQGFTVQPWNSLYRTGLPLPHECQD